jgi:hypothetical protein
MSYATKLMMGITLITIPTIEYGGYFLLSILLGKHNNLALTEFQKTFFRAGHAHAGVIVILSLICQIMVDHARLSPQLQWCVRIGVPAAAMLISGGFFTSVIRSGVERPNGLIRLIYMGVFVLAASLITLGIGLIRAR